MRKEKQTMIGLTITGIVAPPAVLTGSSFTIDVSVTAAPDAFVEGSAYRLFIQVRGSNHDQVIPLKGHLQDSPWITPSHVFSVPVIAGAAPGLYHVYAALMAHEMCNELSSSKTKSNREGGDVGMVVNDLPCESVLPSNVGNCPQC